MVNKTGKADEFQYQYLLENTQVLWYLLYIFQKFKIFFANKEMCINKPKKMLLEVMYKADYSAYHATIWMRQFAKFYQNIREKLNTGVSIS